MSYEKFKMFFEYHLKANVGDSIQVLKTSVVLKFKIKC